MNFVWHPRLTQVLSVATSMMANVARGKSTCEYQTVAEFDQQIIDSFKADILAIVEALLEAKVVPKSLKDDILQETGFTDYCKASKLRNHVVDGVKSCPQTFYMLCDALEGSGQKDVAQILREHCKKLKGRLVPIHCKNKAANITQFLCYLGCKI